jgi:hypothetical protein
VSGAERPPRAERLVTAAHPVSPTDPAAVRFLAEAELRPLGLMPRASNYTFMVELSDGGRTGFGVYKPREGETPLWDFPEGTLCNREVAAFVLARALGWPRVPPTVLREGPHGPGSVQLFVEPATGDHFFTLRERCLDEFRPVAVFDVIANNADRKSGHCLPASDGSIWVVDHGVCFGEEPKLRTVIWDFAGERVPGTLLADVERVAGELRSGPVRDELLGLLGEGEVEATAGRAEDLLRVPRFPHPGPDRAYPWPPV